MVADGVDAGILRLLDDGLRAVLVLRDDVDARARFVEGGSPFAGPVKDQDGETVWAEGEQPSYDEVETMDFFVAGVVGETG